MTRTLEWKAGVYLFEEDGRTKAKAVLDTGVTRLTGRGVARCNPQDVDVPEIGDELAVSRAMSDLAGQLMRIADRDLEAVGAGEGGQTAPDAAEWKADAEYGWPDVTA
ncbi:DUF1876 domain-containing protein [Streptomyces sp. MUM 178J]|uniref:DUF1876 domain-containing protein n=1 Tax=Streptomyces sp. MUM 178J TaxID=2791991 RepID=UPI001F03AD7D|nr:DUF1876 domain-containing protein [Streptomyces sp. MUM 178J]WRQ78156.1 DUF1876 domain-containing protein [Streptomyces sp. MUM 178J]